MEPQPKLNNSKEVIAYLATQFPLCFIAEGEAKPLKIGIFQDLVTRLENDTLVSKTQLRSALRLYTTSWRYLYGIKVGAERVDLDGQCCGVLEQEHVDFAREQLEQAKARIKAQHKEKNKQKQLDDANSGIKATNHRVNAKKSSNAKKIVAKNAMVKDSIIADTQTKTEHETKVTTKPTHAKPFNMDISQLKSGQKIKVKVGKEAMDATIVEVNKEGARVQLLSGMSLVVRPEHLVF